MKYKTLNKILFNFFIYVPVKQLAFDKEGKEAIGESYDLREYYPLRDIKPLSVDDFRVGDTVKFS